jgi:exoribonuclease II
LQEAVNSIQATVLRENLCRFDHLPLVARVASLPALASGSRVVLDLSEIDLLELTLHCEYRHGLDPAALKAEPAEAEAPVVVSAACNG